MMSWSYAYDPQIWPALVTAILTAILGWYGWQRRNISGAKPFAVLCLFAFLWSVGCIFEISSTDFSTQIFWIKFQGIWQMPEATTWPWFVLVYAGFGRWLTRRNLWLMITPSIFSLVVIVTNDYHHLVWTDFQMGDHVIQVFGIVNWVLAAMAFVMILFTIIVLIWLAVRSSHLRWPAIIMLLGMVVSFGIYLVVNVYPEIFGPGERILLTMGILSLSFSLALFRFRVLDPVPLAYSAIVKQIQAGVLVLDLNKKAVGLNPAAGQILGRPPESLWGHPAAEILPAELNILNWLEKPEMAPSEIKLGSGSATRYYNVQFTPLKDQRNRTLGHLLLLHDFTEQKRIQEQILEQQQAVATLQERERLARELHDSTGQVLGYVNLQAETIHQWLQAGNSDKADSLVLRLAEVAKEAHADIRESILNLKSGSAQVWYLLPTLRRYLDNFQSQYGIRTELVLKDGLKEDNFKPDAEVQLLRVIQEALTNARKHGEAHNVMVAIERGENRGHITVTDDGNGFDPNQTKLEGSQHFGLAFMNERMAQIGGTMKIESRPGAGTTIRLEAPNRS
jgi:signal transduction histidine kinase